MDLWKLQVHLKLPTQTAHFNNGDCDIDHTLHNGYDVDETLIKSDGVDETVIKTGCADTMEINKTHRVCYFLISLKKIHFN